MIFSWTKSSKDKIKYKHVYTPWDCDGDNNFSHELLQPNRARQTWRMNIIIDEWENGVVIGAQGEMEKYLNKSYPDLYANTSYRHQDGNKEYVTLHMTNRFDDKNKLLSYFTQQYLDHPSATSRKVMGRARYFHTFNDLGTELLIVGGYQYASDPILSNKLPLFLVELNTPLFTKQLSMMLGVEGDYLMTKQKDTDGSWNVFNHDIYLQFTYALPKWKLTVGNRVLFYDYTLKEEESTHSHADIRNNSNACVIFVPDSRNQIQLGYYRKYYNPSYQSLFMNANTLSDGGTDYKPDEVVLFL